MLPPGLEILSAVLRFYQYEYDWYTTTRIDHLQIDPIAVTPSELWNAPGLEVSPQLQHDYTGWVEREFNSQGREALRGDLNRGWSAYRINVTRGDGFAHGAGHHQLEPRIAITYRPTGMEGDIPGRSF